MLLKYTITDKGRRYSHLEGIYEDIVDLSKLLPQEIDSLSFLENEGSIVAEITMDMFY